MAGMEGVHLVLGATGGAGRALVREVVRRGHRVRSVSCRAVGPWPQAVETNPADIRRAKDVRKACRGTTDAGRIAIRSLIMRVTRQAEPTGAAS